MTYKRINKSLTDETSVEFVLSNNKGIYINSSVSGRNTSPYHGLFIKQQTKNDEIYLSKMIETIQVGNTEYNIWDLKTNEKNYGGVEYLEEFTDIPVPTYKYNINGCIIQKKYKFTINENILCIEYRISNNSGKIVKFNTSPCITKRKLFGTKRESLLKFTSLMDKNAAKVSLSISEEIDLYIKSQNLRYNKNLEYINGVNYDLESEPGKIKTYIEDLFVPGSFEGIVRSGNTNTFVLFVSTEDIDTKKYNSNDIELEIIERKKNRLKGINETYHELISLAESAYNLHYVDNSKKTMVLLESIPNVAENDEYIKNIISSLEGNYIILKRYKEAKKILESMMYKLKDSTYKLNNIDRCEAILLFIEAVNRYLQESECGIEEIKQFYGYIKETLYEYMDRKQKDIYMDKDYLIQVDGKKYIKLNALWYNALRVFVYFADKFKEESEYIYSISENTKNSIIEKFWDENKGVLKYEVEESSYANFDMIYSLSLSYPVMHDNIAMKVVDTTFKELYTHIGMRLGGVNTKLYDGYVYPHLMAHFLKANLRQMGVTRATQKLAYNLIKDMLSNIGRESVSTVKYKYNEKNKKAYGYAINALTNAEVIRAFEMLT